MAETESDGFITWNGGLLLEEPPIWTSGVTTLEEEATGLVIGAILMVNSLEKMRKKEEKARNFS